jgi:hypothetical protein
MHTGKKGIEGGKVKRLSLTLQQKNQVYEVLENWKRKNKPFSIKNNKKIPKTVISLVIDIAILLDPIPGENYFADIDKLIKEVSTMNIQANRHYLKEFFQQVLQDKEVKQFSYDQFLFFLYWLRRIA